MSRTPWKAVPAGLRLLPVVLVLLPAGCGGQAADTPRSASRSREQTPATPAVTVVRPVRKSFRREIVQPGEIQAFERTPLYARISGYVEKVHKDIGDPVKAGEILAELSVPERDEELAERKALVAQARAEVEQAKKVLAATEAELQSAAAKVKEAAAGRLRAGAEQRRAQLQYERLKKTSGVYPEEVLAETRLGAEAATAAVAEVEARVLSAEAERASRAARRDKAGADVRVAEARLEVARAAERRTAALLGYAKLQAPFAGVVIRRHVDPGHLLQAGGGAGQGEPVFVVARVDPVRIFVDVPETDAVLVKDGTRAEVRVQALGGEGFPGKVTRSAWALDPKGGRTLRTEIDLKNPGGRLRPGMYAHASIAVEHANVLAVPVSALVTQGEQTVVYRVEGGKALRTPVTVGLRDKDFVEVGKWRGHGQEGRWRDFGGAEEVIVRVPGALADGGAVTVSGKQD